MGDIIASIVKAKTWIIVMRVIIMSIVFFAIISTSTLFYVFEAKTEGDYGQRIKDISEFAEYLAWGFFATCILLVFSITLLIYCLHTRSPKIDNLSATFKSETTNLRVTLIFFGMTYILRWISDKWVIPWLIKETMTVCYLNDIH